MNQTSITKVQFAVKQYFKELFKNRMGFTADPGKLKTQTLKLCSNLFRYCPFSPFSRIASNSLIRSLHQIANAGESQRAN